MLKKVQDLFEQSGLSVAGNAAHGILNGYEVNCVTGTVVRIHIAFYASEEQKAQVLNAVKLRMDKTSVYAVDKFGVAISVNNIWTLYKTADKALQIANDICRSLNENGALGVGYCPVCGKSVTEQNSGVRNVDGMSVVIDNECAEQINETITKENAEFEAAPNNYLKGFFGALIGGAAGAVIAIILNVVGFYAGISSFVAFFVGVLLYKKFGGKPNKMMIVIVTVTTFVMMIIAVFAIYLVIAGIAAVEAGVNMNAFEAFGVCMQDNDFSTAFIADMAMTLLFTIIGCVSEIVKTARDIQRRKNI